MELITEIEPILWAYIADVPQEHIMTGRYVGDEEERVDEAIKILNEEGHIYLEYVPDYDIGTLENIIEQHVLQHGVRNVFFDYIHVTTDLISEFQSQSKARMQIREDQVLANLSLKLKELTRKYDISLDTWTQVSGDFKNEQNRDQTIVRGAKSIIDKCDTASIVSEVTKKEYKYLEKIVKNRFMKYQPNRCISVYKNRGGEYTKCKVWLYIDYATMRVHDLFCTDYDYDLIDMPQTFTRVEEDQKVIFSNDKEVVRGKIISDAVDIAETAKEEGTFDIFEDTDDVVRKIKETLENDDEPFLESPENKKFRMVEVEDDDEEEKASTKEEDIDY